MDRRTKREKLEAMARQSVSPNEAKIAQEKLNELKEETKETPEFVVVPSGYRIKYAEPQGMVYNFAEEKWEVFSWTYVYEYDES